MRITLAPLLIALALASAYPARAPASDAIAAITTPVIGQGVVGVVHILGSATHPSFNHYELHFALDPNRTDTWFPIVLSGAKTVEDAQLGQWDTSSISTGTYILRLQVFGSDGSLLAEAVVTGIVVRAGPEPATPTPAPTAATSMTPAPVATSVLPIDPQRAAENTQLRNKVAQLGEKYDYRSIFVNSAAYSVAAFLTLWMYLQLRKIVRPHVRRLLRRMRSDLRRP